MVLNKRKHTEYDYITFRAFDGSMRVADNIIKKYGGIMIDDAINGIICVMDDMPIADVDLLIKFMNGYRMDGTHSIFTMRNVIGMATVYEINHVLTRINTGNIRLSYTISDAVDIVLGGGWDVDIITNVAIKFIYQCLSGETDVLIDKSYLPDKVKVIMFDYILENNLL